VALTALICLVIPYQLPLQGTGNHIIGHIVRGGLLIDPSSSCISGPSLNENWFHRVPVLGMYPPLAPSHWEPLSAWCSHRPREGVPWFRW
jgi:hypothetical protein